MAGGTSTATEPSGSGAFLSAIGAARAKAVEVEAVRAHLENERAEQAPPSIALAIERSQSRLPTDQDGRPYAHAGLSAPHSALRTLGTDAAFYVRTIERGFVATLLALLVTLPALCFNMGMFAAQIDYEYEYAAYEAAGLITGTDETSTWTVAAQWSDRCPLGEGAPLLWGRPGGNSELLGAEHLSWPS